MMVIHMFCIGRSSINLNVALDDPNFFLYCDDLNLEDAVADDDDKAEVIVHLAKR